jgi:creatinine amidohydrolase/Fe(II)-dependent formamide hydrolase-like protein
MQLVLTCLCVLPGWAAPLHAAPAAQYLRLPAVDTSLVWPGTMPTHSRDAKAAGVTGDPTRASAGMGKSGLDPIVRQSIAALRAATAVSR